MKVEALKTKKKDESKKGLGRGWQEVYLPAFTDKRESEDLDFFSSPLLSDGRLFLFFLTLPLKS